MYLGVARLHAHTKTYTLELGVSVKPIFCIDAREMREREGVEINTQSQNVTFARAGQEITYLW